MAVEKPIKPLAEDYSRRQRYAELLVEAQRMTVPRLQPGDADVPACGIAWRSCPLCWFPD